MRRKGICERQIQVKEKTNPASDQTNPGFLQRGRVANFGGVFDARGEKLLDEFGRVSFSNGDQ